MCILYSYENIFLKPKDKIPADLQNNNVYKSHCKDCKATHIGESKRLFLNNDPVSIEGRLKTWKQKKMKSQTITGNKITKWIDLFKNYVINNAYLVLTLLS